MIGAAVDVATAVYLGPITVIPILLFSGTIFYVWLGKHEIYEKKTKFLKMKVKVSISGFFLSLNNIPVYMQWLSYVAYVRYGFEGTMQAIYGFEREKLVRKIC